MALTLVDGFSAQQVKPMRPCTERTHMDVRRLIRPKACSDGEGDADSGLEDLLRLRLVPAGAETRPALRLARDHVAARLLAPDAAAVLAGRPGADATDPGPTVCAGLNVGINTLRAAIECGRR